jgi:hypothetical protein
LGSPDPYGPDRLFVVERDGERLAELEASGARAVRIGPGAGPARRRHLPMELATAIAAPILQVDPFDQPNVDDAKDTTQRASIAGGDLDTLAQETATRTLPCC